MLDRRLLMIGAALASAFTGLARGAVAAPSRTPQNLDKGGMDRRYLYVGGHRVHYRRRGDGAPTVILPNFSKSSLQVAPLAAGLGGAVVALDLPGNGESSALPGSGPPAIDDYAAWLEAVLTALGLKTIDLIAFETSAPVAVAFARQHPDRVRRLALVEPPLLNEAERAEYLQRGCPPLIPDDEGSHLTRHWGRLRDSYMFSPWFKRSMVTRIARDMPPADRLYDEILDLFRAGPNYWHGLHAGWTADWSGSAAALGDLVVLGSAETARRLEGRGLAVLPIARADDWEGVARQFGARAGGRPLRPAPPPPPVVPQVGEVRRDYVKTSIGQILTRRTASRSGRGTPLVLLHGSLWSSEGLESKLLAYSADRPVLTFDVPGVGDSPAVGGQPQMVELARVIVEAIDALGLSSVDLQGGHSGAMMAIDLAILLQDRVRHVVLDGVTMYTQAQLDEMLPRYLLPLRISDDGAFMNWAWQFLRDMYFWYPWYDHRATMARSDARVIGPDAQHRSFVDFLKGGRTFPEYYRAALTFPTRTRIPLIRSRTLLCCAPEDTLRAETVEAAGLATNATFRFTAGRGTPEAAASTDALYLNFLDDKL